jgi:hypothetical protein
MPNGFYERKILRTIARSPANHLQNDITKFDTNVKFLTLWADLVKLFK